MENLENAMKLATHALGDKATINYQGGKFHYSCGYDYYKGESLEDVENHINKGLFENWMNSVLKSDAKDNQKSVVVQAKTPTPSNVEGLMKTRAEWSLGKIGDPRKKPSKNRKNKRFTKTNVLGFMRQRVNGKFSSEKISYEQYCSEFLTENKKAESRRNWRKTYGKKASYDHSKILLNV